VLEWRTCMPTSLIRSKKTIVHLKVWRMSDLLRVCHYAFILSQRIIERSLTQICIPKLRSSPPMLRRGGRGHKRGSGGAFFRAKKLDRKNGEA
jgi:hypothetical protein